MIQIVKCECGEETMDFEGNCIKCHKFRGLARPKFPLINKRGDKITVACWENEEYVVEINGCAIGKSRSLAQCEMIAAWFVDALDELWAEPPTGN